MADQPLPPLEGVPGTDASASKRGYYYQDVVTALAWTELGPDQVLLVEVAEDYAVAAGSSATIHQVRDVASALTLKKAIPFLEHVVTILEDNPSRQLLFVYRTTSSRGLERQLADRPSAIGGLDYWDRVKSGDDPAPLISVLQRMADEKGRLSKFLRSAPASVVVKRLIAAVTWATNEPSSTLLQMQLSEKVATVAHDELDYPWTDGNRLVAVVIDKVTKVSLLSNLDDRRLTRASLLDVLKEVTHKSLPFPEYRQLVRDAARVKNPPTVQVNADVERRLEVLRKTRMFPEAVPEESARRLAKDVSEGGTCELADPRLRALALSWCARILAEEDEPAARALLSQAKQLAAVPHNTLVEALLAASHNIAEARKLIANETDSNAAQTIRYVLERRRSLASARTWIAASNLRAKDFDPDGMFLVLMGFIQEQRWQDALVWLEDVPDPAFDAHPALLWVAGLALVANSVPEPMQSVAAEGPPVTRDLPLSDEPYALLLRRRAAKSFRRFAEAAVPLRLLVIGNLALEYSLWLQLRDRVTRAPAISEVLQLWEESGHDSIWLPLALSAQLPLDVRAEAEKLDRRAITYGSLNFSDARARFALLLVVPPAEWIDQWPRIRQNLFPYFTPAFIEAYEIDALVQAGRLQEAKSAIDQASHIPGPDRERLLSEIAGGDANSNLVEFRAALDEQRSPATLHNLIVALRKAGSLQDATQYAQELFELARDHESAEGWMSLLKKLGRWAEIESFLDLHPEQVEQSHRLAGLHLEAMFRHGRWEDATRLLSERPELVSDRRQFELKLAVLSGNWEQLGLLLEQAQLDPLLTVDDQRQFAHLAHALGRSAISKRLAKAAAVRSPDDPGVLLDCYNLAVQGRWEDDPEARDWLPRAIELSDENGPVQAKTLDELVEMAPAWREKTESMGRGLATAQLYLGLVAQHLNRPLASLMLGTAESNRVERDFRRRSPIATFAGISRPALRPVPSGITLDQTALLTLGHLRLLPRVLKSFQQIWVPHSVGAWLFAENQDVQFHQPSRIFEAQNLLTAIARQDVRVVSIKRELSKEVSRQIGDDLAQLFSLALADREAAGEAFVVRIAPIHTLGSLMRDEANVSEFASVLRSMLQFVSSLNHYGVLADEQFERATAFLAQHDKGWESDELLPLGATLYLDDISVAYMHHLDLWGAAASIFRLAIHPDVQNEAAELVRVGDAAQTISTVIEDVRRFIVDGQSEGVLRFLREPPRETGDDPQKQDRRFLLMQSIEQQEGVQAIIVDDRAANQFPVFSYADGSVVAIRTTLDVFDWLLEKGSIESREWDGLRNDLRRSGYIFISVISDELVSALSSSRVRDGQIIESASARAIRENHLLAQASGMLQLPGEVDWLTNHSRQILEAMSVIWEKSEESGEAEAKSSWLVELGLWEGIIGRIPGAWSEERLVDVDAIAFGRLLFNNAIPEHRRAAYNHWLQDVYLTALQKEQPLVFEALCSQTSRQLSWLSEEVVKFDPTLSAEQSAGVAADVCKSFVNDLPVIVRERLFEDDAQLERLGLRRSTRLTVHIDGEPSFDTRAIYDQVARAYAGEKHVVVADLAGTLWSVDLIDPDAVRCSDSATGRSFEVEHAPLVALDPDLRKRHIERIAIARGLRLDQLASWRLEAADGPLHPHKFAALNRDLQDTVAWQEVHTRELFKSGGVTQHDLVPLSMRYYERLVEPCKEMPSLSEFAAKLRGRETSEDVTERVRHELMWSAHSSLAPKSLVAELDALALRSLCRELVPTIDLWSLTGLVESVVSRGDAGTEIFDVVKDLLAAFQRAMADGPDRLHLTVGLGSMVDAALNTSGVFQHAPVYWRRHASLAHASLLERSVLALGIPAKELAEWAQNMSPQFQIASLTDLYREPRWGGFMFTAPQLAQELIGRVVNAVELRREEFGDRLDSLVFGDQEDSLASRRNVYFSALPGPLEGSAELAHALPEFLLEQLSSTLSDSAEPLAHRLLAAAHLAGMGSLPIDAYEQITKAVVELSQADVSDTEREQWPALLMRVSLAASSSRDEALGAAVMRLVESRPGIPLGLRVYAGVTACGFHADSDTWTAAVSTFLATCASVQDLTRDQADELLFVLGVLGNAQPLLRPALGQTLVRLKGVSQRIG